KYAAPDPGIGELARLDGLENLSERLSICCYASTGGGFAPVRHVMTQRLPERKNAPRLHGGSEQYLNDRALSLAFAQMRMDLRRCRHDLFDEFFQKGIVLVGEHLGKAVKSMLFRLAQIRRQLDCFGALV